MAIGAHRYKVRVWVQLVLPVSCCLRHWNYVMHVNVAVRKVSVFFSKIDSANLATRAVQIDAPLACFGVAFELKDRDSHSHPFHELASLVDHSSLVTGRNQCLRFAWLYSKTR